MDDAVRYGHFIVKHWFTLLLAWIVAGTLAMLTAPAWNEVATDGELQHLPPEMPSRAGERLFREAFPNHITKSTLAIILHRSDQALTPEDDEFVHETLAIGLRRLAEESGGLLRRQPLLQATPHQLDEILEMLSSQGVEIPDGWRPRGPASERTVQLDTSASASPRVVSVRTPRDPLLKPMLVSADEHATIVVVQLTSGFLETRNVTFIDAVQEMLDRFREEGKAPAGLELAVTGSAMAGRDTIAAVTKGTEAVRRWAIWIVIALLFVVFRAPIAAFIPLVAMYTAVEIALAILAWGAYLGWLAVFDGLQLYVTILVYGAGVDYSIFLMARQMEELRSGRTVPMATLASVVLTGTAILASAGTEIVGIGLLVFAEFGKFQQAAIGVALGLAILLLVSLTMTPGILRLGGRWIFWPQRVGAAATDSSPTLVERWAEEFWRAIGRKLQRRPLVIGLTTTVLMAPLAVTGLTNVENLTYGLVAGLPLDAPSVRGIRVLEKYFSPGEAGPIVVLLRKEGHDFSSVEGMRQIEQLTDRLLEQRDALGLRDVRSAAAPLGRTERARLSIQQIGKSLPFADYLDEGRLVVSSADDLPPVAMALQLLIRQISFEQYVSHVPRHDGEVTRMTVVLRTDPFSRRGIEAVDGVESAIREYLPEAVDDAEVFLTGAPAGLRDVRNVARNDWGRIIVLVPLGVFFMLLVLLQDLFVCAYLIITMLFSFFTTLGLTFLTFFAWSSGPFPGIEWTVPILLCTLLVAIGVDCNVLLISRSLEEMRKTDSQTGITEALAKTGGLISGAGLIMAGTFSALAIGGTLTSMKQLGFALTCGVLIDTFIVRPLLVPSFLQLRERWKLAPKRDESSSE